MGSMRRVTIVVPGLVVGPTEESALRKLPEALAYMAERGTVARLAPLGDWETPEAAYLGLDPGRTLVAQGPLMVAALGVRPPEGSVHFHLSLCSVDEGGVLGAVTEANGVEGSLEELFAAAMRLRTSRLTPVRGEGLDHALVWEDGSLDLETTPLSSAIGRAAHDALPTGEGENMLRRFVDDSINLLGSLELNRVRREEGLAPLNCLWPWGQGFRPDLPNLPLRRGDVVHVESGSFRLQGLCRLVGYAHGPRGSFASGLRTDFDRVRSTVLSKRLTLTVIHTVEEMQRHHRTDETVYTLNELDRIVLVPLLERAAREPFELCLAAPAEGSGLVLRYSSAMEERGSFPFDERVLDDVRLSTTYLWEAVEPGFVGELERQ